MDVPVKEFVRRTHPRRDRLATCLQTMSSMMVFQNMALAEILNLAKKRKLKPDEIKLFEAVLAQTVRNAYRVDRLAMMVEG